MSKRREGPEVSTAVLVRLARSGDQRAWESLVDRYQGLVWATARRVCRDDGQAADVVQNTWVRMVEYIGVIRSPEHLPGWLTVTTRREAWRSVTDSRRAVPVESLTDLGPLDPSRSPVEEAVLEADRHEWLLRAADSLPVEWQPLFGELMSGEGRTYQEISRSLGIPVGSIGPTRGRCIRHLRLLAHPA